jgi:hypothetical protein
MESLTFASSQKEESDSAERRWENEGGNPGQFQQLACDEIVDANETLKKKRPDPQGL